MRNMKKAAVFAAALMMILAAVITADAQESRKVYWGISGETLVLSAADTGLDINGTIDADAPFDPVIGRPWLSCNAVISAVKVDGTAGKVKIKDCMDLFYGLNRLTAADLSDLDTSDTVSLWCMFDSCASLKELDLSMLDTSKVTNMQGMFYQCASLEKVNVSGFNTANVTNMYAMFAGCRSLKSLDLSSFDMSKVEKATDMFADCENLSEIKIGNGWTSAGEPSVSSWKKEGENTWYCIDMNGNKETGWQEMWWNDREDWYYFSEVPGASFGVCQLGGITPDGYRLAPNGAWMP